ncbi:MAG: hypothetical protein OHK0046_47860 [Anaerolineae bacterium]
MTDWVTAHCSVCGEVPLDAINRWMTTCTEGDQVIETVHVRCTVCGQETYREYTFTRQQYAILRMLEVADSE